MYIQYEDIVLQKLSRNLSLRRGTCVFLSQMVMADTELAHSTFLWIWKSEVATFFAVSIYKRSAN